jgi:hypothetical protein
MSHEFIFRPNRRLPRTSGEALGLDFSDSPVEECFNFVIGDWRTLHAAVEMTSATCRRISLPLSQYKYKRSAETLVLVAEQRRLRQELFH